jgi:hypothetical protein
MRPPIRVPEAWGDLTFEEKLLLALFGLVQDWTGYKDLNDIAGGDQAAQMCARCENPMVYVEDVHPKVRCNACGHTAEMGLFWPVGRSPVVQ